jgi:hypothetical protein
VRVCGFACFSYFRASSAAPATTLAAAPRGALAASGAADGSLRVWRLADGALAAGCDAADVAAATQSAAAAVTALAFADGVPAADGAHAPEADAPQALLSGAADGSVRLWAAHGGDGGAGADAEDDSSSGAAPRQLLLVALLQPCGARGCGAAITALAAHAGARRMLVVRSLRQRCHICAVASCADVSVRCAGLLRAGCRRRRRRAARLGRARRRMARQVRPCCAHTTHTAHCARSCMHFFAHACSSFLLLPAHIRAARSAAWRRLAWPAAPPLHDDDGGDDGAACDASSAPAPAPLRSLSFRADGRALAAAAGRWVVLRETRTGALAAANALDDGSSMSNAIVALRFGAPPAPRDALALATASGALRTLRGALPCDAADTATQRDAAAPSGRSGADARDGNDDDGDGAESHDADAEASLFEEESPRAARGVAPPQPAAAARDEGASDTVEEEAEEDEEARAAREHEEFRRVIAAAAAAALSRGGGGDGGADGGESDGEWWEAEASEEEEAEEDAPPSPRQRGVPPAPHTRAGGAEPAAAPRAPRVPLARRAPPAAAAVVIAAAAPRAEAAAPMPMPQPQLARRERHAPLSVIQPRAANVVSAARGRGVTPAPQVHAKQQRPLCEAAAPVAAADAAPVRRARAPVRSDDWLLAPAVGRYT